jgi:hypothetical protein
VSGLTRSLSLITRETVIAETPESRATSLIVAFAAVIEFLVSVPQDRAEVIPSASWRA